MWIQEKARHWNLRVGPLGSVEKKKKKKFGSGTIKKRISIHLQSVMKVATKKPKCLCAYRGFDSAHILDKGADLRRCRGYITGRFPLSRMLMQLPEASRHLWLPGISRSRMTSASGRKVFGMVFNATGARAQPDQRCISARMHAQGYFVFLWGEMDNVCEN